MIVWWIILLLGAYLVGSIPSGWLIARLKGIENIRQHGSGNIGATNVARLLGTRYFLVVFFADFLKAFGYMWLLHIWSVPPGWSLICAVVLLLGNTKSIFLFFTGGKGVATSFGLLLAVQPYVLAVVVLVFVAVLLFTRTVGIASVCALFAAPLVAFLIRARTDTLFFVIVLSLWCIFLHSDNIKRFIKRHSVAGSIGANKVMQEKQLDFLTDTQDKKKVRQHGNKSNKDTMKFSVVAQAFDLIEQVSGRLAMTKLLAQLFESATPDEASIISYLSLGRLHPPHIGTRFQMAQKSVVGVVARLTKRSIEEVNKEAKKLGDIGSVLASGGWRVSGDLTVTQVYNALKTIAEISGTGAQEAKISSLEKLLQQLDAPAAKFVARIVVGKLRLGFSDMTIIDALSWMQVGDKSLHAVIENAYNISADIGLIAQTIKQGGMKAIKNMKIQIGVPIRPAAAERQPTAKAIIKKLGPCVAQPKLDGFRLQIHIDKTGAKPRISFFSRNLLDMTYMFPDLAKAVGTLNVKNIICEGEAIVYDPNTGSFLPFQETVKRKRKHGIEQAIEQMPLRVFIFDLLYLDGEEYLNKTHAQRRKKLLSLFKNAKKDTVQIIEEKEIHTAQQLENYFNANIAAGLEGLVVKREDAIYQPGKRNFNWIKLKRQEEGHLEDTIDCVILGYYAGKGKRAKFGIGALLVGLYNKKEDCFQTVAKIGTGFSDSEWKEVKKKGDARALKQKPANVVCPKALYPDVWVAPEIVCLVRADEITVSPLHTAGKTADKRGLALRFPRFMGYRPDKSPQQATSVVEIKRLYKNQFIK